MLRPRPDDYAEMRNYDEGNYVPGEPMGMGRAYPAPEKVDMFPEGGGDPPPEPVDPAIFSVAPPQGPDGTSITIAGENFPARGANGRVQVGTEDATIDMWGSAQIVATVSQGGQPTDIPLPVVVHFDDGSYLQAPDTFTLVVAGTFASTSGKRKR